MSHEDVTAIVQVVNLYGLAIDSQRWAMFERVFTPDVDADYGPTSRWADLARFKADFAAFHAPFDATQHMMAGHVVAVAGDAARCWCNGSWRLIRHAAEGDPLWDGTGWYDDDLVRTPEGWRIRRRACRITWWTGNPAVNETIAGVRFDLATTSLRREAAEGRLRIAP